MKGLSIALVMCAMSVACGGSEFIEVGSMDQAAFSAYLTPNANAEIHLTKLAFTNSNFENVDDQSSCDGLNTYNYATPLDTGAFDVYRVPMTSINNGRTIKSIRIVPCASKHSNLAGSTYFELFYRLNATESEHSSPFQLSNSVPTEFGTLTADWFNVNVIKDSNTYFAMGIKYIGCPALFCAVDELRGMRVSRMLVRFEVE